MGDGFLAFGQSPRGFAPIAQPKQISRRAVKSKPTSLQHKAHTVSGILNCRNLQGRLLASALFQLQHQSGAAALAPDADRHETFARQCLHRKPESLYSRNRKAVEFNNDIAA